MKQHLVITIEREYGSGGRLLGKALSEELGIPYYDDEIIRTASEYAAVGEKYFRLHDEKPGKSLFGQARDVIGKPRVAGNITNPDNLFRFEAEAIRKMADRGSCIFIGRSADFVLDATEFGEFVSLFVYCDMASKVRRVMEVDAVDAEEAMSRIQKINRQRRDYCRYYTGNNWGDPMLYDLPLNTTKLTIPQTAELVKTYLRFRGLLDA
ncbi:cytidylate kinase-like family protein [Stomatobaculum sp. F0698]|uniref:cytidylate kinase-like family protein n=1 Tax=Stomatobaculum sp. F0698 TaxID=3059030 RepID=UPI00272CD2D9|nr:cytidylate kinase-like family protein [Stomatobaculum sp. F0698]WLD85955.1 cytidylate kinase-like family protein [Stomatobaculum sp. F0698]